MQQNQINEWFELYKSGLSLQEIADKFNLSKSYIQRIISNHPDYNPELDMTKRNESIIYYHQHRPEFSIADIARIHEVSRQTINRICKGMKKAKKDDSIQQG